MRKLSIVTGLVLATVMVAENAVAQADTSGLSAGTQVYINTVSTLGDTMRNIRNNRSEGTLGSNNNPNRGINWFNVRVVSNSNISNIFNDRRQNLNIQTNIGSSTFESANLGNFVQDIRTINTSNDNTDLGNFVNTFVGIQSQSTGQTNQQVVRNILNDLDSNVGSPVINDLQGALQEVSNTSPVATAALF